MMPILYVTDTLSAGGIERQLATLIQGLDRSQFEPHVLCLYGERVGRSTHFAPMLRDKAVPVTMLDIGWTKRDKVYAFREIIRVSWRLKPRVLQAMNYHSNMLSRLARPLLPPSLRLVGTVRNQESDKQLLYHRLSWRLCYRIICNSPHLERDLIERARIPASKVRLIPNGLDIDRFRHNPQPGLRAQLAPNARRLLVLVGRIGRQKSPHLLAEALGILKERGQLPDDTAAVIVGEPDTHPLHATQHLLDEAMERYQLEDILAQYPPTDQPEAYYHAGDITVLPSLYEGLPNVMLESLAVGRPVIISADANRAGVIEQGRTGWIVPTGDAAALADTILLACSLSDDALEQMQVRCRETAARFSISSMVKAHEAIYVQTGGSKQRHS